MSNQVHIPHPYLGNSETVRIYVREVEYSLRHMERSLISMLDRIVTDGADVFVDPNGNVLWAP